MNTDIVFGTCDYAAPDGSHFFFRVEGHIDDKGDFAWLPHHIARRMFPDQGTIRVLKLPNKGRYGMFQVVQERRNERPANGASNARFRASPIHSTVYQVWRCTEATDAADAVAKKLSNGIQVIGEVGPFTSILILFADDILCGPVRLRPVANRPDIFTIDPQSLARPCEAWKIHGGVRLHKINVRHHGDMTFATTPTGKATTFVDFAPVELALKKVLEHVRQSEGAGTQLTPAKIQELAASLSKITPSDEFKPRLVALMSRLNTLDVATSDFTELLEKCLTLPAVQKRIEQERSKARDAVMSDFAKEQVDAVAALSRKKEEFTALSSEINNLSERKEKLQAELERVELATSKSREKFVEAIAEEARKAEDDVAGFLARAAVLRPFLTARTTTVAAASATPECLKPERVVREAKLISSAEEGVKHLTDMLQRFGVDPHIATNVAVEVVAALALGQAVAFRGSLSAFATTIVSQSLSAASLAYVSIPVGTRLPVDIRSDPDAKPENNALGVVINGANCSCIDAYGGLLIETVRLRVTGVLSRLTPPYVFLCLREGPSTLLPTAQMAEIAPIFHTDTWKWVPQTTVPSLNLAQLKIPPTQIPSSTGSDFHDNLRDQIKDIPSNAFVALTRLLLPLLTKLHNERHVNKEIARERAICSLINSWVLPFLTAHRAKPEIINACVQLANDDKLLRQHVALLALPTEC